MKRQKAFTLIELLVVISIIALLISILMPALNVARAQAKKTVCMQHLQQLGLSMTMYVDEFDGWTYDAPNSGLWRELNPGDPSYFGPDLDPSNDNAYWGIAYSKYAKTGKQIFHCPSQKRADDWPELGLGLPFQQHFYYCSYGLNGYASHRKIHSAFNRPSEVIFVQDHIEQKLDGVDSDMLCPANNTNVNLRQWRSVADGGTGFKDAHWADYDTVKECFRHLGYSNLLWLDGHVSDIYDTYGVDENGRVTVYQRWYRGY